MTIGMFNTHKSILTVEQSILRVVEKDEAMVSVYTDLC